METCFPKGMKKPGGAWRKGSSRGVNLKGDSRNEDRGDCGIVELWNDVNGGNENEMEEWPVQQAEIEMGLSIGKSTPSTCVR
jgi:hypothetical protein